MAAARAPAPDHQDRGQHPGVVRVRHKRHQDVARIVAAAVIDRLARLSPSRPARLRGDLIDHPGTGQLIELLFERAQPGVISRMPGGLHLAVAADHCRRGRGHLHEQQLLPGTDLRVPATTSAVRPASAAGPARRAPGPPAGSRSRAPGSPAASSADRITLTCGNGVQRRGTVELHPGLLCEDWRQIPLLLQEPAYITRNAAPAMPFHLKPACSRTWLYSHRAQGPRRQGPGIDVAHRYRKQLHPHRCQGMPESREQPQVHGIGR